MEITSKLKLERETKNKYRYYEAKCMVGEAVVENGVGTIYITKSSFEGKPPETLNLVISDEIVD